MKSNNTIWLIIVLLVLVGGYLFFSSTNSTEEGGESMGTQEVSTQNDTVMIEEDVINFTETVGEDMDTTGSIVEPATKGTYEAYSPEKLARANDGDVVLFFKASWCPSCRALENDIQNNIDAIPEGVTLLEINYDTATDLKTKYGVTVQHTLVQVDENGDMINKWVNSPTLERVLSNIQ